MDDSCAVCADTLEWVAYGPCGHREVCSTCVARLRFICQDRRCCICKLESDVVFVTKALGDYTRVISDFSVLPSEVKEGRLGSYWYHEDTQAFFDDVDHYKMVKAMCKLSCSVCDKMEDEPTDGSKRRGKFRNIEQLKGHLFHKHRLVMCNLCLEGRKIFICEQKLYNRAQLIQHISTGDSGVDGSESERGGFTGHPKCEFCRSPFYGDNELYTHMSTEHYTCHICQRVHPAQYEYYKNYDDLEIHFRHAHFLCEDESCLAKKFIVFISESEMKRHNAIEHGGRMSRSKRNAALQIPTSFRYRRNNEQAQRRSRGQTFLLDSSDNQLSMAIEASLETANRDATFHDSSSSSFGALAASEDASDFDPLIQPFDSLAISDAEASSRYLQALGNSSRTSPLEESSFPPLANAPGSSSQPGNNSNGFPSNTMAAHLRRQRKVSVINSAQGWPAASRGAGLPSSNSANTWPARNDTSITSRSSGKAKNVVGIGPSASNLSSNAAQDWPSINNTQAPLHDSKKSKNAITNGPSLSSNTGPNLDQSWPAINNIQVTSQTSGQTKKSVSTELSSSSYLSSSQSPVQVRPTTVRPPSLAQNGFAESTLTEFPPVSAAAPQARKLSSSNQSSLKVEDVQTANKSLVEKIQIMLEFDPEQYSAFKDISAKYRQGKIDTELYLGYVHQFGLSHLVPELARLCPDPQKQKELMETYNANFQIEAKDQNGVKKGKWKSVLDGDSGNHRDKFAESIISSVKELQSSFKPSQEEVVEELSKDGYRGAKGKSKIISDEQVAGSNNGNGTNQSYGDGGGPTCKHKKKTSKFHRVRLGDGSLASLSDQSLDNAPGTDPVTGGLNSNGDSGVGLPVRGVWRKGSQKLFPKESAGEA